LPSPPVPTLTQSGDTLYSCASAGNQWYLNGDAIPGATGNIYIPTQDGNYMVSITNQNNCSSESLNLYVNVTGINDASDHKTIRIYPNFTSGIVHVENPITKGNKLFISLLDAFSHQLLTTENQSMIDLRPFENGIYFLVVENSLMRVTHKIVLVK